MKASKKIAATLLSTVMFTTILPVPTIQAAEFDPSTASAVITLAGDAATAEGDNVTIDGTKITITASGSYLISGTLDDGQIVVNVPDETADPETVKLYFNGVTITGNSEAAVYVINAENTSINLMDDTENYLYDGQTYTETQAVIHAKDDLTIKSSGEQGNGKLRIESLYNYGIQCNNDLKFNGGNVKVRTEAADAVRGKTSVEIKDGKLDINSAGDGLKSTKGDVVISGGKLEVKASNDAVQGETSVQISGGKMTLNGDRGITNAAGVATITGGTILATATKLQATAPETEQPVLMFDLDKEQVKDQVVSLTNQKGDEVFAINPDKKFSYVLISDPALVVGETYALKIGETAIGDVALTDSITITSVKVPDVPVIVYDYDLDGDGEDTVSDAVLLARMVVEDKSLVYTDLLKTKSDINQDGLLNVDDLVQMLKHLAKKI